MQNKMSIVNRLHTLVWMLNTNEDYNGKILYGILTNFIRKLTDFFFTMIGEKESSNIPLNKIYSLEKVQNWNVYMDHVSSVGWLIPIFWYIIWHFWEKINKNLICCHGYTNYVGNKQLITWVLKKYWEMFHSGFPKSQVIIPCPRKIIYNSCDQNIVSGYIFYYGGNVDEKEYFGFSGSFFKKSPSIIDNITKRNNGKFK